MSTVAARQPRYIEPAAWAQMATDMDHTFRNYEPTLHQVLRGTASKHIRWSVCLELSSPKLDGARKAGGIWKFWRDLAEMSKNRPCRVQNGHFGLQNWSCGGANGGPDGNFGGQYWRSRPTKLSGVPSEASREQKGHFVPDFGARWGTILEESP